MSKTKKYNELLKDSRWKEVAKKVKDRDGNKCIICDSTKQLNAHHKRYGFAFPWENPLTDIITLCKSCHKMVHDTFDKQKKKELFKEPKQSIKECKEIYLGGSIGSSELYKKHPELYKAFDNNFVFNYRYKEDILEFIVGYKIISTVNIDKGEYSQKLVGQSKKWYPLTDFDRFCRFIKQETRKQKLMKQYKMFKTKMRTKVKR
jgi:hypothetical protein